MLFDKKCPSNVIFIFNDMHNGNMKLEHFIDIGKSVPKNYLVERLNAVNKQGITDIDLNTRTYKKGSITLPIYKLSTGIQRSVALRYFITLLHGVLRHCCIIRYALT